MSRSINIIGVVDDGSSPPAGQDPLALQEIPLEVAQGEDFIVKFLVRTRANVAYDLTGCTAVLGVARAPIDASQQASPPIMLRAGAVQAPASAGALWFTFVPADTLPLEPLGQYRWDPWITLANATRQRLTLLSPIEIDGAIAVPGAATTAPSSVQINSQSGLETFTAEVERTVTIPSAYLTTGYKVLVSGNDAVGLYYQKLTVGTFKIKATAPWTGEASWRTEP